MTGLVRYPFMLRPDCEADIRLPVDFGPADYARLIKFLASIAAVPPPPPSGWQPMTEARARVILGPAVNPDGSLDQLSQYLSWNPGEETACLDSDFEADELEAIAWWMRNTPAPPRDQEPTC